ncbi:MAG: MFS transporter [Clostridia bacterium]
MKLRLFRNRSFALLILCLLVSNIGTLVQQFAISLYVLNKTGSGLTVASIIAVSVVPQLIFGPFVGVFVDKVNRKQIIVISDFLCFVLLIATASYLFYIKVIELSYLYLLTIVLSLINMVFQPAFSTMIPSLIEKDNLLEANSIKSFVNSFSNIVSPIIAAFFFTAYGLLFVLILNAISFLMSGIFEIFIDLPRTPKTQKTNSLASYKSELLEGLCFIKANNLLLQILIMSAIANFALSALVKVTLPYAVKEMLHCTDSQFGFYSSAMMFGLLISPLLLSKYFKKINIEKIIEQTLLIIVLLVLLMSLDVSPIFIEILSYKNIGFYFLTFLSTMLFVVIGIHNISVATVFHTRVPNAILGRTNTLFTTITLIAAPLGQLIFGFLLDYGIRTTSLVIIAAITLVAKLQFSINVTKKPLSDAEVNANII